MQRKQGKEKKRKKAIKVQDLRPSKNPKGGLQYKEGPTGIALKID
jgi:hypothetical protein